MTAARNASLSIAAIFAAVAVATPMVVSHEGWVTKTYADPIAKLTACAGVTEGVVRGRVYTERQCQDMTSQALLKHALAIRPCLPENLPTDTRAAFVSFGYNVGAAKFCASTISYDATHGRLPQACAGLSKWVYAGGRVYPGLVARRAEERALCEKGLRS